MRANWFSSALEKRNFNMLTLDGVLYYTALTFLDATILIPLFLEHLSGSAMLIGLATAIRQFSFVAPQMFIARLMSRIPRLTRFVFWSYLICRFAFLFVIAELLHDPSSHWVLIAFFVGYSMFTLGEGVIQVPWMDLFGRTISPQNHGKLFGVMQTFGAIGAFAGGLVIQYVLARPEQFPYPTNFLVMFSLAFVVLFFSTLSFLYVKEGPRRHIPAKDAEKSWWSIIGNLPRTWRNNRAFRTLMIVQLLVGLHQLAMPFYILYVQKLTGVVESFVGFLVIAQIVGGMFGGVVLGGMSTRLGNQLTVRLTVFLNVCVPVLILLAGRTVQPIGVELLVGGAFFLMGMIGGGWIGVTNYLMEISNDETRGCYVAYLNTCTAPLAILPVFSGKFVHAFSYETMFVIVLILLLVALYWSWKLPITTIRHRRGERVARSDRQTNAAPQ
ncbi:MAG: MFS transporter [Tumebacillaceae bacterium]